MNSKFADSQSLRKAKLHAPNTHHRLVTASEDCSPHRFGGSPNSLPGYQRTGNFQDGGILLRQGDIKDGGNPQNLSRKVLEQFADDTEYLILGKCAYGCFLLG